MATRGRIVWHELLTTDVEAAKAFYTEVIGWKTQPFAGDGSKDYTMFCVGEQPIGGLMLLPEQAKAAGAPPHWLGHVAVPDSKATAARAKELGATVYAENDIPEVGSFSIVADPQGAVLSYFTPTREMSESDTKQAGEVGWNELNTTDYQAAWTYYRELFGWQETESMDMGPDAGTYFMFKHDGGDSSIGGMSNVAKQMNLPPHWLFYIQVEDLDGAIARIKTNGGAIMNGPMDVPGGRVAQCQDPQGGAFAIHCPVAE